MPTKRLLLLLVCLTTLSNGSRAQQVQGLDPDKRLTQYVTSVWTSDDGLPQASVTAIRQTRDGYLWFGTQEGVVRFDGIRFEVFDKGSSGLTRNPVSALHEDAAGRLWVGTREGGLSWYSSETGGFHSVPATDGETITAIVSDRNGGLWVGTTASGMIRIQDGELTESLTIADGLPTAEIATMMADTRGDIWIGTNDHGVLLFDGATFRPAPGMPPVAVSSFWEAADGAMWIGTANNGLYQYRGGVARGFDTSDGLPEGAIRTMYEDVHGSLWIGSTHGGLARYSGGTFEVLTAEHGLPNNDVSALLQDREGSMWIGTSGGGLAQFSNGKFSTFTTRDGLAHDITYGVFESSDGALWVGTEEGGVSRFFEEAFSTYTTRDGLSGDYVLSIAETADGAMWFGSRGGGLSRLLDGKFTTFTAKDGLPTNQVYSLYADSRGTLWIATSRGGLTRYKDGRFNTVSVEDGLSSQYVTVIWESVDGDLWVGTYDGGLNQLRGGKVIATYTAENGLRSNYVTALFQDTIGILWVGTRDGGLHRIEGGQVVAYSSDIGLFDDTVLSILADDNGNFWMSCNKGLFRVSRRDLNEFAAGGREAIESVAYTKKDGLLSNEFNGGFQPAAWKGRDGRLWFPSNRGLVSVRPDRVAQNLVPPLVAIEVARADGARISEGAELEPGPNRFDFRYVGLSFIWPEQIAYQYRLDGFNTDWSEPAAAREVSFTNLDPGTYTFRVRARNADGIWSDESASVTFTLQPFFHQTAWFYLLCGLLVLLVALLAYRLRVNRLKARQKELEGIVEERTRDLREEKEKTEVALKATEEARRDAERQKEIAQQAKSVIEAQAEKLREMDRIKSRFFGNISHEFRTPLTLTIGPLENALTGVYGKLTPALARQLDVMLRNSRRLLRLINQLLDLTKLESGNLKLKVRQGNFLSLIEGVVLSFTAFAEKEGIQLDLKSPGSNIDLFFDAENLEKVFFNLLSNAVKFTPSGGAIEVMVTEKPAVIRGAEFEAVEIKVRDSGAGIPASELPYIFDRFHQVDGTVSRVQEGTGIGLSLVKELVDLHGGKIRVESTVGEGTEFTVMLPKSTEHLENFELVSDEDGLGPEISHGPMVEMAIFDDADTGQPMAIAELPDGFEPTETVLIVDDNLDIRDYVVGCLTGRFNIITARDGVEGLEKARASMPNLVISDVMMPRMDGYELCRSLKDDPETNHIPVILLTSKASIEAKIEGLEAGSDDYIAKPFNAKELLVRVDNLLRLREQARTLKGLNSELVETNDALREASELKTQLLNIASHDMKNPLTAIREFSRIIKEEVEDDSHLNELLDLIYSSSNEMLALVTQLLDSAALESGKLRLDLRPVDVGALAEIVVQRNRPQAERKGQEVIFDAPPAGARMATADFNRLQEAMDNLISNAIKYSPHDKRIWVEVGRTGKKGVQFTVRDEGPGITPDDAAKLWGKFQKLSNQPTGGESSTGLGLSIVKQIVEMHGGRVAAETEVGVGSAFTIELGVNDVAAVAPSSPAMSLEGDAEAGSVPAN